MIITALLLLFILQSPIHATTSVSTQAEKKVQQLKPKVTNIKPEVLDLAVKAYKNAKNKGLVKNERLTVIDYSLPSNQRRKWVIDMKNNKLDYYLHVTHGKNSGLAKATRFSNRPNSLASSLGTFITAEPYQSAKVGYALRLRGMDKGFNDNALRRGVVIHGAKYANPSFLKQHNRLGRSWGCPAVKQAVNRPVIERIKHGSVVFVYANDKKWLASSAAMHQV